MNSFPPARDSDRASDAARLRVLVVDDYPDAAVSLGLLLKLWGHEVEIRSDGEAALQAVHDCHPDVVLSEIQLHDMDGCEVARRLRHNSSPEAPVLVAMTTRGSREDRQRTRQAGFDHHLLKPADPSVLERLLRVVAMRLHPEMSA